MANHEHISGSFGDELEAVKNKLLEMGGLAEQQIKMAIEALNNDDKSASQAVISRDELVNEFEINIDEDTSRIIALRQPAASDLRLVISVTKISTDLERIGDEAVKIARQVKTLRKEARSRTNYAEIKMIGERVSNMLRAALDAFTRSDPQAALEVKTEDKLVDKDFAVALDNMLVLMAEDASMIKSILCEIWVLKALERIGDHACNIAEQVIFLDKGIDVRHLSSAELRDLLAS